MDFLNKAVQINVIDLLVVALGFFVVFIICLINLLTIKKITKRYDKIMRGLGETGNLEGMLNKYLDRVDMVQQKEKEIQDYCNQIDRRLVKCFQKSGVVRYKAFENTGSDLSFAIALLDANDDGFVINGVYSRDGTCTYAKPIINGETKYALSAEESQALESAKKV